MTGPRVLRVGTRQSVLATAQTRLVMAGVVHHHPDLQWDEVLITTEGDRFTGPLHTAPTPGIFVSALRDALLAGDVDCVVHSMKDLPGADHPDITLAATPLREDPSDTLVSVDDVTLDDLPAGARVGTSSPRRTASIRRLRPDLLVEDIRGNITTRIEKVARGDYHAAVLAQAGLVRAGLTDHISHRLPVTGFLPAPRQGVLAIEIRRDDHETAALFNQVNHDETRLIAAAEQGILLGLEAGCHSAVSALATIDGTTLTLLAELADPESGDVERVEGHTSVGTVDDIRAWSIQLSDTLRRTDLAQKVGLQ